MAVQPIVHANFAKEFKNKFDKSLFSELQKINSSHLNETSNQLLNWPIFEEIYLLERALSGEISREDKERLSFLNDLVVSYMGSDLRKSFYIDNDLEFRLIKPGDKNYFIEVLNKIPTCYEKSKIGNIVNRYIEDITLGGSIIYIY